MSSDLRVTERFNDASFYQVQKGEPVSKKTFPGLPGGCTDNKIVNLVLAGIFFLGVATVFYLLFAGVLGPQFSLAGQICGEIFLGTLPLLVGLVCIKAALNDGCSNPDQF